MQQLGRKKLRFPGKRNERFGRGFRMWWETIVSPNKTAEKREAEREIVEEIERENKE